MFTLGLADDLTMQRKPRTEEELKKLSIRLLVVVVFLIYLLTPTGQETFKSVSASFVSLFTHHSAAKSSTGSSH
jgi:hypothetical protein